MEEPQAIYQRTGERIRFFRKLKKLSQEQLAAAIYKSESTISKYESGLLSMDLATLYDIAAALEVELYQLIDVSPRKAEPDSAQSPLLRTGTLYGLFYAGSKLSKGVLTLEPGRRAGGDLPCALYADTVSFDSLEKCRAFYTGWVRCYEWYSLAILQNQLSPSVWIGLAIQHPSPIGDAFQSAFFGIWPAKLELYAAKGLFFSEKPAVAERYIDQLRFTAEELRLAKKSGIILF